MKKIDEIADPESCLNKAKADEMMFVLLARDPAAPAAIQCWIRERVRLGLNTVGDSKMVEAEVIMTKMTEERKLQP